MTNDLFYHKELLKALEVYFINGEWFPLFENNFITFDKKTNYWSQIYGYLIEDKIAYKSLSHYEPDQKPTTRVAVMGDYSYRPFANKGIEPLIINRNFSIDGKSITYTDLSEELIFYFNLYEEVENKQNRKYYYINYGEKNLVIKVESNNVYIKYRFLMEYLAIRRRHYMICFKFEAESSNDNPWNLDFKPTPGGDKGVETNDNDTIINRLVRRVFLIMQSCVTGKKLLCYKSIEEVGCHYESDCIYESFVVGFDEIGREKKASCESNELLPVFFSKDVLDKYYSDPTFTIEWSRLSNKYFSLKMDNNHDSYVVVFLKDLAFLPHKEQLHWKAHNISPSAEYTLSRSYYNSMILGNWNCGNETEDLLLKEKYSNFNVGWFKKYAWYLFKPLAGHQLDFYKSLHIPTSNKMEEFCNQIETLALMFVDSINVKNLKTLVVPEKDDKHINLLKKFLMKEGIQDDLIIEFLRNLQTLRSGLTKIHRYNKKNTELLKAKSYFNLDEENSNVRDVAKTIFQKAIDMIDYLNIYCG
ncbi:MAG: hypothetical protein PHT14_07875 [Petrimonas sp.]|nr:hypothetical protein [Petrimonas sp.]MDD3542994.1 hypothetical protein [Petrimonas sp.]